MEYRYKRIKRILENINDNNSNIIIFTQYFTISSPPQIVKYYLYKDDISQSEVRFNLSENKKSFNLCPRPRVKAKVITRK